MSVHISAAEVRVQVDGKRLRSVVIELARDHPGPTQRIARNGEQLVRFPLRARGGPPSGAWVVLRRDNDWLDRRFLAWPYARSPEPGVEIEIEPSTRLEMLVAEGEGPGVEVQGNWGGDRSR